MFVKPIAQKIVKRLDGIYGVKKPKALKNSAIYTWKGSLPYYCSIDYGYYDD